MELDEQLAATEADLWELQRKHEGLTRSLRTWLENSLVVTQGKVNAGVASLAVRERYECALDIQRILREYE
jgi:hypothetical protein